jgi:hypothetical protein
MHRHFSNLAIRDTSSSSQPSQVPVLAQNQDVDMADQSHQFEPQTGPLGASHIQATNQPQDCQPQNRAAQSSIKVYDHTSEPPKPVKYIYLARRHTYDNRGGNTDYEYDMTYGAYIDAKDAENRLRKETHSEELSRPRGPRYLIYATWMERRGDNGCLELFDDLDDSPEKSTLFVERVKVLASGSEEEWSPFDPEEHVEGYESD